LGPASERISFEIEQFDASDSGRVQLAGRWYGIRGRRFMRPTLICTSPGGDERQALAELDGKPWAAEDGDLWRASFVLDGPLDAAEAVSLAVAPDITVALSGETGEPIAARRLLPRPGRAPGSAARTVQRLEEQLGAAERALAQERERRAAIDERLESERAEGRRLRAELGRLQAEVDLADAARAEADAAAAELEAARHELEAAQRRHELLRREHRETVEAHTRTRSALDERGDALQSARTALAREQAETVTLRARLDGVHSEPAPTVSEPVTELELRPRPPAAATRPRPLNPSLRHRRWWLGRFLALLVMAIVIAAIIIVIKSTVS
jgi:hypothetical protein